LVESVPLPIELLPSIAPPAVMVVPLEELGIYDPRTDETRLEVEAIVRRLKQGAQPTETVRAILNKAKIFDLVSASS
jgi:ribosomal protein S16